MRYRDVEEDEKFQARVKEDGKNHPAFGEILQAAKLYIEGAPHFLECEVVGSGASHNILCLPSRETHPFPIINFYFYLDSRSVQDDVAILHDFLIEQTL